MQSGKEVLNCKAVMWRQTKARGHKVREDYVLKGLRLRKQHQQGQQDGLLNTKPNNLS